MLDSDCSFHMFSVREYFETRQSCENGTLNKSDGTQS